MRRLLVLLVLTATTAAVFAASSLGSGAATPTLRGKVGPGFTISLTSNGKKVTRVKPGTYRITVTDASSAHNFVLEKSRGGAFEKRVTTVPFVGTKTITVRLTTGRWEFYCAPHEATMEGEFAVGSAQADD